VLGRVFTAAVILACPVAEATANDGVSLSVSEDLEVRWYNSPEQLPGFLEQGVLDYGEQVNRMTILTSLASWNLYTQIDQVSLFANQYYLDDVQYTENDLYGGNSGIFGPGTAVVLEKMRVSIERPSYSASIGDTYAAFGRGIALNINRNVDIDIDTSIRGFRSVYRPGAWDITAVAGVLNRQQVFQDNANLSLPDNYGHMVAGVRVERFGLGNANVGAHGVVYNFVEEEGLSASMKNIGTGPDAFVGGLTGEYSGLFGMDWYAEADIFSYPIPAGSQVSVLTNDNEDRSGHAAYLSSAAYLGNTTWLFEAKSYQGSEYLNSLVGSEQYVVATAPTLEYERVITEDSAAALGSNDIYGGKLRMDWTVRPGEIVPYVSLAVFRDRDMGPLNFSDVPETIFHPVAGLELISHEWVVLLNGGYRVDQRADIEGAVSSGSDRMAHMDLDLKIPLSSGFHADIATGAQQFQWGENAFEHEDFIESETAISLQKGSDYALIGYVDFSNNPLVSSVGNLKDDVYGAIELQVKPTSSLTLKAFYGAYKAGIRCSGGQCRLLPGFDGVRFGLSGRL
jgi:hypothetical protein